MTRSSDDPIPWIIIPGGFVEVAMGAGILAIESLGVSIVITLTGLYLVRRIIGVEKLRSNHEVVDSEMKG
jgi:hypothetical protein